MSLYGFNPDLTSLFPFVLIDVCSISEFVQVVDNFLYDSSFLIIVFIHMFLKYAPYVFFAVTEIRKF